MAKENCGYCGTCKDCLTLIEMYGKSLGEQLKRTQEKKFDCEGCNNLAKEFEKLLMMLAEKFPEAMKYYEDRLRPPIEGE